MLGLAHRFATGRLATPDDFHSGMDDAVAILRRRAPSRARVGAAGRARPDRTLARTALVARRSLDPAVDPAGVGPPASQDLPDLLDGPAGDRRLRLLRLTTREILGPWGAAATIWWRSSSTTPAGPDTPEGAAAAGSAGPAGSGGPAVAGP